MIKDVLGGERLDFIRRIFFSFKRWGQTCVENTLGMPGYQ